MSAQRRAIAHVEARAERSRGDVRARHGGAPIDALAQGVRERGRVTLSFHPDRLLGDGRTVVDDLLARGRYRCQFETGISNGSRTAHAGGDRDRWEHALFGAAYQATDTLPAARPKYGALDLLGHLDGGSPRFGSCYFVLRPELRAQCTFTWGDSHEGPPHIGSSGTSSCATAGRGRATTTSGATRRRGRHRETRRPPRRGRAGSSGVAEGWSGAARTRRRERRQRGWRAASACRPHGQRHALATAPERATGFG